MKLTKHGAIVPTHTPCLLIVNMAYMEAVRNCISTQGLYIHIIWHMTSDSKIENWKFPFYQTKLLTKGWYSYVEYEWTESQ